MASEAVDSLAADSLDVRMEAIRIKNEELEKKHKEILEDEMNAKRENAIVDVRKSDIPKAHPYDKLDLDFDVKDEDKELSRNPDFKPKNRRPMPRNEFLAEIPPDPTNFLREDGDDPVKAEPGQTPRPQNNRNNRNNNNRNRPDRPRQERSNKDSETMSGDSPSRPRNQRPRPQQQQQTRSPQDPNAPVKRPTPPSQLRNERRSAPAPEGDQYQQRSPTGPPNQPNRQRRPNNSRQPNMEGGDRNNITVQISEGEVRSVKLKSPEKQYGTGRVGRPRNENVQKFTVDTFDPEHTDEHQDQQNDRSPNDRPRNRNHRNRRNQKPREFQHPTLENIIIPKASVQDRLLKIAKDPLTPTDGNSDAPIVPVDEPKLKVEAAPAADTSNGN